VGENRRSTTKQPFASGPNRLPQCLTGLYCSFGPTVSVISVMMRFAKEERSTLKAVRPSIAPPSYGGTFRPRDRVTHTCTVVLLKAVSRPCHGETIRLPFFSRSTVPLLDRPFFAALQWPRPADPNGFRLEERPTNSVFSDFVGQMEVLRLGGSLLVLLGHAAIMP